MNRKMLLSLTLSVRATSFRAMMLKDQSGKNTRRSVCLRGRRIRTEQTGRCRDPSGRYLTFANREKEALTVLSRI